MSAVAYALCPAENKHQSNFLNMNTKNKRLRDTLAAIFFKAHRKGKDEVVRAWRSALEMYDSVTDSEPQEGMKPRIIGVYGTPKMGKSTLLNSIVAEEILPRDYVPATGAIIDLHRCVGAESYEVFCYRDNELSAHPMSFRTAADACKYLRVVAGQKADERHERVVVEGPFPNAKDFFKPGYTLRDTPGAITGEALRDALAEDSMRTISSVEEVLLPLFCARGDSLGAADDVAFYQEHLNKRICFHVITHCDDPETEPELLSEFSKRFGIVPDKVNPKIMVCTGKADVNAPFVTHGLEKLVEEITRYLNGDHLSNLLMKIAKSILNRSRRGKKSWDTNALGFPIPVVQLEKLDSIVNAE